MSGEKDQEWRERAACRWEDPELFFPVGKPGHEGYDVQERTALSVCRRCPVIGDCLAWSVDTEQRHGVSGGLAETERRRLITKKRKREGKRSRDVRELGSRT